MEKTDVPIPEVEEVCAVVRAFLTNAVASGGMEQTSFQMVVRQKTSSWQTGMYGGRDVVTPQLIAAVTLQVRVKND